MTWRWFRTSNKPTIDIGWWRAADAVAESPTREALAALPRTSADTTTDDAERQAEMLAGLEELLEFVRATTRATLEPPRTALPVVPTQHRVIGTDRCHFISPVSVGGDGESAGKLFLTSERLIVVAQGPQSWAWHRVRRVARSGRELVIMIAGAPADLLLRCNTYGEALIAAHVIQTLIE